jgi:nucleotide-binding universal stress UspA family protein
MTRFSPKKILAPVDFSKFSIDALRAALDISEIRGAEVTALHVTEEPSKPDTYGHSTVLHTNWQMIRERVFEESRAELETLTSEAGASQDVKLETIMGDPTNEILRIAKDGNFDLIVMSTHGRTGLNRLLMGSVAERVIRHAPCPVFVIRGNGKS